MAFTNSPTTGESLSARNADGPSQRRGSDWWGALGDNLAYLPEELEHALAACVQRTKPDTESIKAAVLRHEEGTGAEVRRGPSCAWHDLYFTEVFGFADFLAAIQRFSCPCRIRSLASGLTNRFVGEDGVPTLRAVVPPRTTALWPFIGPERPSG
jgi:hypothetical protein